MSRPTQSPHPSGDLPSRPVLSPRRRRLRATWIWLGALIGLATLAGLGLFLANRPQPYQPGEESEDITSNLARNLPPNAPAPEFTDVTQPAGLAGFRNFAGPRTSQLPEDMGPGLAWADFDQDGDDDLFLVSAGGALSLSSEQLPPCQLWENLGRGSFQKVASFPPLRIQGMAAAWGDCNQDGYPDLAVSGYQYLGLFTNAPAASGPGRTLVPDPNFPQPPGYWAGLAWGDYDRDRHLDLYVCQYVTYETNAARASAISDQLGTFVPFSLNPASFAPAPNLLLRNQGDGSFTDVAAKLGVDNAQGRSLGALWHDLDDDGWLDLYVANDISDNVFFHNEQGLFRDLSHPALIADYRSAMGMAVGDWNRDGDDDLFITHWVAQENAIYENLKTEFSKSPSPSPGANAPDAPTHAASSIRFIDVNEMAGLGQAALPFVGWGTEFVDLDLDGWLDLAVANGSTIEIQGLEPKQLKPQEPFLFWNQQGRHFHNLAPLSRILSQPRVSRGLAVADYDNDGDPDLALAHLDEGVQLLRNDMAQGHWLKIRLRSLNASGKPTGSGEGSKVLAHVAGAVLRRSVTSVSYLSQSSSTLLFGLGDARQVDRLEVRWLGGQTNTYLQLPSNSSWEIQEDNPAPRRLKNPPASSATASPPLPAPDPPLPGRPQTEKDRVLAFWKNHRAAMNALKVDQDPAGAIPLFEAALELDPSHEDARYYLAQCLAMEDRMVPALDHIRQLAAANSQSHRAFRQWGIWEARLGGSTEQLEEARRALLEARRINPEETGALQALAEVDLLLDDLPAAETHFTDLLRSNHRSVPALFFRGYIAWTSGQRDTARSFLERAREALGPEWQPRGATSEGDVKQRQHQEESPLSEFWQAWDGRPDPVSAFASLHQRLAR